MSISKKKRTFKTKNVTDVINNQKYFGDKLSEMSEKTNDLKTITLAIKAYNSAINAGKAQIIYKKLTGLPAKIQFFE